MLIQFRVANHRSFRDEQVVKMTASSRSETPAVSMGILGIRLVPVACIYGANASGKSNLLHALGFMQSAITESYRVWKPDGGIPREPFLLDESSVIGDSEYEIDFFIKRVPYTYGFKLNSQRITSEWLYGYPHSRKQVWFTRDSNGSFSFGKNLKGPNRTIASLTRENSLFLSAAVQNNHEQLQPIYHWLTTHIRFVSPLDASVPSFVGNSLLKEPWYRKQVLSLLNASDLGITDITVQEEPFEDEVVKLVDAISNALEPPASDEARVATTQE